MAIKTKRKSKTQKLKKKSQQQASGPVLRAKLNSRNQASSMPRVIEQVTRWSRLRNLLMANLRMLVIWGLALVSVFTIWQFSARTSGVFSSQDQYVISFDHAPKANEIEGLLNKYKLTADQVKVKDGNSLEFSATAAPAERDSFITEVKSLAGVLDAQAYSRRPVHPTELYQVNFVIAGLGLSIVSAGLVFLNYRRDLTQGLRIYLSFWLLAIIGGLVFAAVGIIISQLTTALDLPIIVSLTQETFNLYVCLILIWTLVIIYLLTQVQSRPFVIKLLFRPTN